MKRIVSLFLICLLLCGCAPAPTEAEHTVAATTKPVWQFASAIAEGTAVTVQPLVTEDVSCLHDYTLTVSQMRLIEHADAVIINGGGLEHFMEDVLSSKETVIDASADLTERDDPHFWLSPEHASKMAKNIAAGLIALYPEYQSRFRENLGTLLEDFLQLQAYAHLQTASLSCREIITFHDGFSYFADALDLTLLAAMEVEHGSEPAAKDIVKITDLVVTHALPAVFTETNGSEDAALVVAKETGCKVFSLDMAMGDEDYFAAMRKNIDTVKEALS